MHQLLVVYLIIISTLLLTTVILIYTDKDFAAWFKAIPFNYKPKPEPLYDLNQTLKAKDFEYLLSSSDIQHLRRIASHYTSTKPIYSNPETTSLAITLKGLETKEQE